MTFEELRITYQCPENMARDLFVILAVTEAKLNREANLRIEAEEKLAAATVPRRKYRQVEEK